MPPERPGRAAGRGAQTSYMDVGLDVGQRRLTDARAVPLRRAGTDARFNFSRVRPA